MWCWFISNYYDLVEFTDARKLRLSRIWLIISGWLLMLTAAAWIGILLMISGVFENSHSDYAKGKGQITEVSADLLKWTFTTEDGKQINGVYDYREIRSNCDGDYVDYSDKVTNYKAGQPVSILYVPSDPNKNFINEFESIEQEIQKHKLYSFAMVGFMVLLFGGLGIFSLQQAYRYKSMLRRLREQENSSKQIGKIS